MPLTIALATAVALAVFVAWPLLASETGAEAFLPVDVTPSMRTCKTWNLNTKPGRLPPRTTRP